MKCVPGCLEREYEKGEKGRMMRDGDRYRK